MMAAVFASSLMVAAEPQSRGIWSGVYAASQAARGKKTYDLTCSGCHGSDLGGVDGPALAGDAFLRNWLEDNVESLVSKIQTRMPGDAPGSLSREQAVDLTSFILSANEFPAGSEELPTSSSALSGIQIVGKNGPGPVPNFALVLVVGCLAQKAGAEWLLTQGTEPVRTRESAAEPSGRAETLGAGPLGTQTFSLMDAGAFGPEAHNGHKVVVKGLLMREAKGSRLNVTSLQSVGTTCP